ncbi:MULTISPECIES: ectoine synthase [Ruegeria]|uniref:ectoine synthase n=1 Tax=Ruegeria TaxID=97050 RepID=UPI00147B254B|nr:MULTISPECIES: ectoine synthase [Ruegeria]
MFTRTLKETEKAGLCIEWGSGTSHRLLTTRDDVGFGMCHTVVRAGTSSKLQYRNHVEACYCISGRGLVSAENVASDENKADLVNHRIEAGTVYVLDNHEAHTLIADPDSDLILISIFSPALEGTERHQ